MSHPKRPTRASAAPAETPATALSVPIGDRVVDVLDLAHRAGRPVLLEGPTGIGKSQVVAQFAAQAGLDVTVLDLSLLEPPDLVGLPVIQGGRTHYASPAELPTEGRGVLLLEELNRAEIPVMQPALQLLSARRLHGYTLPPGWSCVAAVNPDDGEHQVNALDPALRARFLQLTVHADRDAWLGWARRANVHPVILGVVEAHDDVFEGAPPRSWVYASDVLHEARPAELADEELLRIVLRGYLPTAWAVHVAEALRGGAEAAAVDVDRALDPGGDVHLAAALKTLKDRGRIDAVATVAARLRRRLGGEALRQRVTSGAMDFAALERLLAPLPGDLRAQCLDTAAESPAAGAFLASMGHTPESLAAGYEGSALQRELRASRSSAAPHRARVVAVALRQWLDAPPDARTRDARKHLGAKAFASLAADVGPLGDDLARRLRAPDRAEPA
jgi:hypothetical protein